MRTSRWLLIPVLGTLFGGTLLMASPGCSDSAGDNGTKVECNDGKDNDGDGMTDFPADMGCHAADDPMNKESDRPAPQCDDGRDNDGDGKHDYPNDPGCFAPNQDDETDDCPSGPNCPQCSNGIDDDMNGQTDYPNDSGGCMSASDPDEYTRNPVACGSNVQLKMLPFDGHVMGTIDATMPSSLTSPTCGGGGAEVVYELRVQQPKVIVATTDLPGTTADTVLYVRGQDCMNNSSELVCNDDVSTTDNKSSVTKAISTPGTYYLVVDAHDSASAGAFELQVKFLTGEGVACSGMDDCGPGLVCRVPKGQPQKVCSKHVCEDNVDEDGDGKNGYPDDPGCTSLTDDDESDGCPGAGPNCPECGDGVDNDNDQKTDYGPNGDTTCTSASGASESCVSTDGVELITMATTPGATTGAHDDVKPACASSSGAAPDKTYRIDVPAMSDLKIDADNMTFDGVIALYNNTCGGTALQCSDTPETLNMTNLTAGAYYFVIDGWSTASGTYNILTSGHIAPQGRCDGALAASGAITCGIGYQCVGTTTKTCQALPCSDGIDNDMDGKTDFPFDPGCADASDADETNPGTLPVCSDNVDNDNPTDGMVDFPADIGCTSAVGTSEAYCVGETDAPILITQKATTTGTTTGKANDWGPTSCQSSSTAPDLSYSLQLPVGVQTLTMDTVGSAFDTVMQYRDANCSAMIACDDDGGGSFRSKITASNVPAGGYVIIVDGYGTSTSNNGAVTVNVSGVVAPGTLCNFPLFQGGANAVLSCPTGTTCTGTPAKCQ